LASRGKPSGIRLGIQFKIVTFLLAVAAVSVFSVSVITIRQASAKLKENAALHFGEMAQELALLVRQNLAEGINDAELMAAGLRNLAHYDGEALRRELLERKAVLRVYEDITLIEPEGSVLASTDYSYRGDWRYREVFKRALGGENAVSAAYMISDPLKTVVTFASPVKDEGGRVTSVLAMQLNMQLIWRITDQTRLGASGQASVVDEFGRYVANPDKELVLRRPPGELASLLWGSGRSMEYSDERGRERLASFSSLDDVAGAAAVEEALPGMPRWKVVVSQETVEVLRLVNDFRRRAVIFAFAAFLVVVMAGAWLASTMVRPLKRLTEGAEAIGAGDLDHRVEVRTRDEIGRLAATFNEMAAAVSRDIAERQRAAEALAQSEELYRLLVEISPDAIFLTDLDANVMVANQQGLSLFGYRTQEEILGENFFDHVAEEELDRARRSYLERPVGGVLRNVEFRMKRKGGGDFPAEISATLLRDTEGRPRGFIAVVRDITGRKKAEEALRASEERYRAVFESTGTAMCILGEDGVISMANQEMASLTGRSLEELEAGMRLVAMVAAEDRPSFERSMRGCLQGPAQVAERFPLDMVGEGGGTVRVLGNMARIPGTRSLVVSLVDVTREREYERALEERAQQLRDFLSIASHELRHPITLIRGYVELLAEELAGSGSERLRSSLARVQSSVERLNLLGEELTDASRIEQGRFILARRRVSLEEVIEGALKEMEEREAGNPMRFRRLNRCRPVEADREKLHRLMIILLENAAKFSPPGELVEVELEEGDFEQVVSVLDRGEGVPDEERLRIFDRFYQVEDVLHHSIGLGLGLYIATEIVEAHGGRIWCDPREGGGSAFRFSLPLMPL
jgi:PAS domain S-box-containing protein